LIEYRIAVGGVTCADCESYGADALQEAGAVDSTPTSHMNGEPRIGLGLAVALALCCIGPIELSVIGPGAIVAAARAVWADVGPLLAGLGVLLVLMGISILAPRRFRSPANQEEHA
jgi:hypothetical protein